MKSCPRESWQAQSECYLSEEKGQIKGLSITNLKMKTLLDSTIIVMAAILALSELLLENNLYFTP